MKKIAILIFTALLCWSIISAQQIIPEKFEMTGNISFDVTHINGLIRSAAFTIGNGGNGPYKAWMVGDTSLTTHTIYRPADLSHFGNRLKLPIVVWGNGGCRNGSSEVRNFLSEIASHGFLVLAVGSVTNALINTGEQGADSRMMLDAIDWAIAENNRPASPYYQKIETTKIAAMGQSCGGLMTLDVLTDSRITTLVMWNSGLIVQPSVQPGATNAQQQSATSAVNRFKITKSDLWKIHSPIAYFVGGDTDIATENAADDFSRINHVPIIFASYDFSDRNATTPWGYGHYPCTYRDPNGGDFAIAGVAWLKWQLKNDKEAAKMFTGSNPGLLTNKHWTLQKKNID